MSERCTVHDWPYRSDGSGMCDGRLPNDGEVCNIVPVAECQVGWFAERFGPHSHPDAAEAIAAAYAQYVEAHGACMPIYMKVSI